MALLNVTADTGTPKASTQPAREIRAPRLQEECGGDPNHPLAQEVIGYSRAGRLRCPACGGVVERVFPLPESVRNRWHFRRKGGSGECDHEGETVAHRETKLAVAAALLESLAPAGWEVAPEKRLENGRRPDILCEHVAHGLRVAFEVQYANLSRASWRRRQDDYDSLGIPVYWLLGAETRFQRRKGRDDLRSALENEPGQRIIYVGRFDDGAIEAREIAISYLDPEAPPELQDYRLRVPPADLAPLTRDRLRQLKAHEIRHPLPYALEKLSVRLFGNEAGSSEAALKTPLDAWNEKRERVGYRRRQERLDNEATAKTRATEIEAARERHAREILARWDRKEEA